jgi:transcriptional regulator with XRE-family HTH domain
MAAAPRARDDARVSPSRRDRSVLDRLGAGLRRLREARALTQEEVAGRAGFSAKYVSECERGLRDVPLTTLCAIVEAGLGASLADVLRGTAAAAAATRAAFPRAVTALCRDVSALPPPERRAVVGVARAAILLARRR